MNTIAIIPARAGSKGIPGKNSKIIDGKPLISYTIEAALQSNNLNSICVSSDDAEILQLANKYGVEIHHRSSELATDDSPVVDTINNVLLTVGEKRKFDAIMLLQPTAPIRTGKQIDKAINDLEYSPGKNSLISVCAMDEVHPARMYWLKNKTLEPILIEMEQSRRQDIPLAFYRNGSIYLVRRKAFDQQQSVMVKPILPYIMPKNHLLNIDETRDLIIGEALIKAWKQGKLE